MHELGRGALALFLIELKREREHELVGECAAFRHAGLFHCRSKYTRVPRQPSGMFRLKLVIASERMC